MYMEVKQEFFELLQSAEKEEHTCYSFVGPLIIVKSYDTF